MSVAKTAFRMRPSGFLPFTGVILFFLTWELIVVLGVVPKDLLATPSQVVQAFLFKLTMADPDGAVLAVHVGVSLQEVVVAYLLALAIGIPLGLLMGWFSIAEGLVRPIFEIIRPIPAPAWIPLAIFWFGIGLEGKVFIIWVSGIVPCVINSWVGVRMTNPTLIQMARTYGASNWQLFRDICVPSALPMVFGGLQIALAASWTALVAAELIAADAGLGYLITIGRRLLKPDMVELGMLMVGLTGVAVGIVVDVVERHLSKGIRR